MSDDQKRGFRFNSKPFVVFRVVAYVIIIACLWLWGRQNRRPASAQRPGGTTPVQPSSGEQSGTTGLEAPYPSVTLYGWSVRPGGEGRQQVDVLLKFGQHSEKIEFHELKLRVKENEENLAAAEQPEGVANASQGLGQLTFFIPAGQPEFRAGRVFCWVKDLCILNSNQRLGPEDFDKWAHEMKREAGEEPVEKPDATQPDGAPAVTPPGGVQVPASA